MSDSNKRIGVEKMATLVMEQAEAANVQFIIEAINNKAIALSAFPSDVILAAAG